MTVGVLVKKLNKMICELKITDEKYKEMETLAKELGMLGIADYIIYSMNAILESHTPPINLV